ncbi:MULTISPECIES: CGNR zinc finger domain-containing protein [unclassified Sinorhizobium]|uniref:CGNR zinc finger domain-containing protein n=1 Tax=unclassified Sinorhizobium TaxID=2613772 RepID=UPI0035259551
MLVSMRLSKKYGVPPELALLYDFVNTLDERRYVENGVPHAGGDEIETPRMLESWMRECGLLHRGKHVDAGDHRAALELREALREFLSNPPEHRPQAIETARKLSAASRKFPLMLMVSDKGAVELAPVPGSSALGSVLGQMIGLAKTERLLRLKTCASEECHWIFFDRSKPANRHWCSSSRCGNRQKTRAYRTRHRQAS